MVRFSGMTYIVTGAGSGIGKATVHRLLAEGATVSGWDIAAPDVDKAASSQFVGMAVDVSDAARVGNAFAGMIERLGAVDGLVNCAGIRGVGSILDTTHELWRRHCQPLLASWCGGRSKPPRLCLRQA